MKQKRRGREKKEGEEGRIIKYKKKTFFFHIVAPATTTPIRDLPYFLSHHNTRSLLSSAVPWNPRGVPVRTLTGVWLIVALIISTVYRSNLKAMLILPKVNLPFTTISEFLQTDIPLHIIEGSLADHYTKVRGTFRTGRTVWFR